MMDIQQKARKSESLRFVMTPAEKKQLEALSQYYGTAQGHVLRQLVAFAYERISRPQPDSPHA